MELAPQFRDEGCDVERVHLGKLVEAPGGPWPRTGRAVRRFARVVVVHLRGEEFQRAFRRLRHRREQPGGTHGGGMMS
jgi:hypothetical protein